MDISWSTILSSLEKNINKQSFDMWLKDTNLLTNANGVLKIKVADDVAVRHITEQYKNQIESIVHTLTGSQFFCEFTTENGFVPEEKSISAQNKEIEDKRINASNSEQHMLNPRYTFDNFVIGPNNQLAHAAANSVSHAPATQFNPLFIYGGTGLGKTHLMQAIGHHIMAEKPYLKVLYVPTEQFLNEFIHSIRTNTTQSFRIKYRDVDILLIDDIQFIEKKEETQNEFFHTFNNLYENKKQIVITSDRPPKQLSTLTDRLRSRFEWGMITDIQPPNLETREAILRNNVEKEKLDISDEAIIYVARRIKSTIRALESAISRLKMVSSLYSETITVDHAKNHLKDLFDNDNNKKITITDIMNKISSTSGISVEDMKSKSRQSKIIQPRFTAMYISRKLTGLTTIEIGKEFGDRDHSTVVNAINKIEEDLKTDVELKEFIDDTIVELKN